MSTMSSVSSTLSSAYITIGEYAVQAKSMAHKALVQAEKQLKEKSVIAKDFAGRQYTYARDWSHTFLEENQENFLQAVKTIQTVAFTAIKILAGALLFMSNSSLFLFGALYFYIDKQRMRQVLTDIKNDWERSSTLETTVKVVAITGAVLAWPAALAIGAFLMGNYTAMCFHDRGRPSQDEAITIDSPMAVETRA